MNRSLDSATTFARAVDPAVPVFVVDWSGVVELCERLDLWDERRLEDWLLEQPSPSQTLAPLVKLAYASEAMRRIFAGAERTAIESGLRHALVAQGLLDVRLLRALCRDELPELPVVFAERRVVDLLRPSRAAPFAVTILADDPDAQVEYALRRSEARYRAIVEDQTDFIVRYRADGIRTFVNNAYAEFFGGAPEDFVGASFLPLIAPEHMPGVVDKIRRLVAGEAEALADEHLSIRHDGVVCWTHWIDRAIFDERGRFVELQAVGRDITERKHAEQRLAQAQKMEALGTLASGLAHDFNNTLSGILGMAELIVHSPEDRRAVMQYAEAILEATERASELTHSLLRLGRQAPVRVETCDVREIVESAARLLRVTVPDRIRVNVDVPELPAIRADAGQLTQALINLGLNARDAIVAHGTIEITARLEQRGTRELLVLTVADDGAGIPEPVRPRVFEPFYTTKPDGEGTGLGLAMVYACARAHRGRVEFDSEIGCGTRFELRLPLVRAESLQIDDRELGQGAGRTILLVDDDPIVRLHLRMVLERDGYRVLTAASKADALEQHGHRIAELDLVVTDMVMPDGSGRELEQALHRRRPELPIVLITGGLGEAGRDEFAAVLEKPVSPDELLRCVSEHVG